METVTHKTWGIGTILKREVCEAGKFIEVNEGGNYITVRFDNGKEVKFAIPKSFENGILEASGVLKDEVNNAAEELERRREEEKAKYQEFWKQFSEYKKLERIDYEEYKRLRELLFITKEIKDIKKSQKIIARL